MLRPRHCSAVAANVDRTVRRENQRRVGNFENMIRRNGGTRRELRGNKECGEERKDLCQLDWGVEGAWIRKAGMRERKRVAKAKHVGSSPSLM